MFQEERSRVSQDLGADWPAAALVARQAVFRAVFPIAGEFLAFTKVCSEPSSGRSTFTASCSLGAVL